MGKNQSNFKQLERFLATLLLIQVGLFLLFLCCAGAGLVVLKIVLALFGFLLGIFGLWMLSKTKEIWRSRSFWLTCSFCSPMVLMVVSLLCGYPCP